jgi:TRAP-type mannitol/chloroaromatic compound transport system permease small subunit
MGGVDRTIKNIDRINEGVGRLTALVILPMLVVMIYEVIMRYYFQAPTVWGTEMTTFLFAAYTLMGAGYTHLKNAHVNMNALYGRFSPRAQAFCDLITWVGFLAYCGVLLYESTRFFWDVFTSGRASGTDWNPRLWPVLLTLPLGVLLLLLQGVAKLIRSIQLIAATGREEKG